MVTINCCFQNKYNPNQNPSSLAKANGIQRFKTKVMISKYTINVKSQLMKKNVYSQYAVIMPDVLK